MTRVISANDTRNVVNFNKAEIMMVFRKDDDMYMVIGGDTDAHGEAFKKLVEGKLDKINIRGLEIYYNKAILTGYDYNSNSYIGKKLNDISYGERFQVPSTYDYENRCAYKMGVNEPLKYREPDVSTYIKYCVSRIGNPKHHLMFKIRKDVYLASEFYNTKVKPRINK